MADTAVAEGSIRTGPVFGVMLVGAFVAFLNQTLINIALPQIMEHLHISATTADWLTTVFMLVNGIVIPITAFMMERFTTRQLYMTSMGLFTLGSLVCAAAPGFSVLLIGRIIQAAGAGILFPLITNVIFTLFPIDKRGWAMGVFGIAINFAPAIGPTLSGWIVQTFSWRVLFFIIFPIALANLISAYFLIRNVTETGRPRLDTWGVILSTLGFGGVLYGFATAGTEGWTSYQVVSTLGIGGIALALFVWRQLVIGHPILEFRIFKYSVFSLTTLINVVVTMAMYSGMILMPIYMQNVRGFSPMASGLMLLPGGVVMGIMSPITGKLFDRFGAKWLSITGLIITVVTTHELTRLQTNTTFTYVTLLYTARMFGMSILMMPIFTAGLNALPMNLNRHGTAMVNTLRMMAGAVGMALFVTIMVDHSTTYIQQMVMQQHLDIRNQTVMEAATRQGTVMGINDAFFVANILTVISLLMSFFLRKSVPLREEVNAAEANQPKLFKEKEKAK